MVKETTSVKELLDSGYDITAADGSAIKRHLVKNKCPKCGAYLEVILFPTMGIDDYYCTECNYCDERR